MPDVVYDIAARFGFEAVGVGAAVSLVTQALGGLDSTATRAEQAADRLGVRSTRLASSLAQATPGTARYFELFGQSTVAMAEHTSAVNAAADAHAKLGTAMQGAGMIVGGAALTMAGAGILGVLDRAVNKATLLQTTLIGVTQRLTDNSGLRLSGPAQLAATDALTQRATQVGLTSGMSTLDVANIIQSAEGAGITSQSKLMTMMAPLTNLAEVLKLTKGMDPTESATVATQFSHLFGAYGDKKIGGVSDTAYLTDLLTRALFVTPSSPSELLNLTSQFVGPLRTLYGSSDKGRQQAISQSIETAALLSRLGQETRGGTQFAQIITRLAGAGRGSVKGLRELQEASGVGSFFNAQGQLTSVPTLVQALASVESRPGMTPRGAEKIFYDAFGTVGTRLAGLLADPATTQQMSVIATSLGPKGLPSEQGIQQAYNSSRAGQLNQASKNMEDLQIALGTGLVPVMTAVAQAEVAMTRPLVEFTAQHKTITALAADFAAVAGAAALVSGPILLIGGALKILNVAGTLGTLRTALTALIPALDGVDLSALALDAALGPVTLTVVGLAAGAAASVYAWQNYGKIMDAVSGKLGPVWRGVATLVSVLDPAIPVIALISGAFHNWDRIMAAIGGTIKAVTTDIAKMVTVLPSLPSILEKSVLHLLPNGDLLAHQLGLGGGGGGALGAGGAVVSTSHAPPHAATLTRHTPTVTHNHGPVTIHIHQQPHQDAKALAEVVWQHIAEKAGQESRRQGSTNTGWDLGYAGM